MAWKNLVYVSILTFAGCEVNRDDSITIELPAPAAPIVDIDPAPHASDGELPPIAPAQLPGWTGKVIGIVDGDTIDVLTEDKKTERVRLNGIDTPERGQPFGNNAKERLSNTIGGKMIRVVETDEPDRYGRLVADIFIPFDGSGPHELDQLVNLELVRVGLAWHYVRFAPDREDLARAERLARDAKRGLWAGSHRIVAPWDWRKLSKAERDGLR